MKTIEKRSVRSVLKLAFLVVLFLTASCSHEMAELEDNQKRVKPKNSKAVAKTIVRGADIKGTNGIYFGPDDNLYIASFYDQKIIVMNKQNGKILRQFDVDSADDLVFHPDGNSFYYTDVLTGFVVRMGLDGTELGRLYLAPGANPITFLEEEGENPRLFAGTCFLGDGLYELDPGLDPSKTRAIVEWTGGFPVGIFNAFDFGPDGLLYGPVFAQGFLAKVNVGEAGDLPTTDPYGDGTVTPFSFGFAYPVAAKFGPDGLLTVLDQNGEVSKVNIETGEKTLFATLDPGLDNLAFDADGTLYISNADFGWIVEILPSGQARTISRGGMIGPQGLAVLPGTNNKDKVFVGNIFRMHQFNGRSGKEENIYKGYLVPEANKMTMPFSVQADGENLLVSSWFSGEVQVWSPETDEIVIGEQYEMEIPIDAVRVNGEVIVSDLALGVAKASDQSVIAPLAVASGLATDGVTLWAADWATGQVFQIDFDGTKNEVARGLSGPEGLAFEKEGSLVVVEAGASRLSRIDLTKDAGENVSTVVDNLELSGGPIDFVNWPPTWWFDGVAVGPSGDIYISGGGANVLYRVSPK